MLTNMPCVHMCQNQLLFRVSSKANNRLHDAYITGACCHKGSMYIQWSNMWSSHLTGRSLPHTGNIERHHRSHSDHHIEHTSWTTCPQTSSQGTSCDSLISACRHTPSLTLYIISTSIITRVGYCLNYHQFQFRFGFYLSILILIDSQFRFQKKWSQTFRYQTYLFYVSFCKTFNCCWIPWTKISQLHKNWTRLRAVFVQNRAAKCFFFVVVF